jgi:hypothetical protein
MLINSAYFALFISLQYFKLPYVKELGTFYFRIYECSFCIGCIELFIFRVM